MKERLRILIFFGIFAGFSLLTWVSSAENEKLSPNLQNGIAQYKHENYEEALPLLKKAKEEDPSSTLAAYYLGLDYKQLQDFKSAIPHLRDAVTYLPKIKGALIELVDCLYSVGELDEANKWIKEAEKEGIRPAQVAFLKGLVLLKENHIDASIASFEKAKSLDKLMEQASDYQIGIAHMKAKDFHFAREAFKKVAVLNPSSNMAMYANEYMSVLKRKEKAMRPWKLSAGVFWQYDDNVVLKPDNSSITANIADKADSREVYTVDIGYTHRYDKKFSIKGQYFLYFAKQNDLGFYDTLSHTVVVQPNFNFKNASLSFPVSYSHIMVDDRSYLSYPSVSVLFNKMISANNMLQTYVKYGNKDYLWTPSTPDENRDSNGVEGGAGWYRFFAGKKGFVNVRYALNKEWTKGTNWNYTGNRVTVTALCPITDKLNFTLSAGTFFQNFEKTHTVYNIQRRDNVYTVTSLLAYKILEDSQVQLQYTHILDDSNISVYGYERNIYSIGIQIKI